MKCQRCDNQAMFHITELEAGEVREVHLCEDHARVYLNQTEAAGEGAGGAAGKAGPLGVAQTAEELSVLDQKACEMCGITFFEFRNQGRLGCPHDYVQFEEELEPLITNVHGATAHTGRMPPPREAAADEGTEPLTQVIGLRRGIAAAIQREDYEEAGARRDAIRQLEAAWGVVGAAGDRSGPRPSDAGGEQSDEDGSVSGA